VEVERIELSSLANYERNHYMLSVLFIKSAPM
jgi:hypothetical protein